MHSSQRRIIIFHASEQNRFFYNLVGGVSRVWQLLLAISGATYLLKKDVIYQHNRQTGFFFMTGITFLVNGAMSLGMR